MHMTLTQYNYKLGKPLTQQGCKLGKPFTHVSQGEPYQVGQVMLKPEHGTGGQWEERKKRQDDGLLAENDYLCRMMTQQALAVRHIADGPVGAADIPQVMDHAHVTFTPVAEHDWADLYPYCPEMAVRLAHTGSHLLVDYRVTEACVRAVAAHDNGNVWEDSCCELFLEPLDVDAAPGTAADTYYNMECNAAGTLLIGSGHGRADRVRADQQTLDRVDRWASLGRTPFADIMGERTWQLCLAIPAEVLFSHTLTSFGGLRARGNVYKCGDRLPRPHFLSLFPVVTPKPDFHRPDCFGSIRFE